MTIHTIADIIGGSATVALTATQGIFARRIWLTSLTAASRFGDASTSASQGVSLPTNVPVVISASDADITDRIDLTKAYVYVASGSTVTVSYAT
jgi:hypothetical protein